MDVPRPLVRLTAWCALGASLCLGGAAGAYADAGRVTPYGDQGAPTRIVTLGDDVPAGTACDCDDFGRLVAADAALGGRGAVATDLGTPGTTTDMLLAQLTLPDVAAALAPADVVVVTIGAHDVSPADAADPAARLATLRPALAEALARVSAAAPHARILVTGYWNVLADGAVARGRGDAYVASSHGLTAAVNEALRDESRAARVTYVDLGAAYASAGPDVTPLLTADGSHPSAAGHRVIATALENALADHSA